MTFSALQKAVMASFVFLMILLGGVHPALSHGNTRDDWDRDYDDNDADYDRHHHDHDHDDYDCGYRSCYYWKGTSKLIYYNPYLGQTRGIQGVPYYHYQQYYERPYATTYQPYTVYYPAYQPYRMPYTLYPYTLMKYRPSYAYNYAYNYAVEGYGRYQNW